jgi:hypothetical protein
MGNFTIPWSHPPLPSLLETRELITVDQFRDIGPAIGLFLVVRSTDSLPLLFATAYIALRPAWLVFNLW